jgi:hypothetical protein
VEAVTETIGDLLGRQHSSAGGRQLDGQRDAVEASADLGHGRSVVVGHPEVRANPRGTVDEQPDRLALGPRLDAGSFGAWQPQGWDPPDGLAVDPQWLAAGCHHPHGRAATQQQSSQGGACRHLMFAVVQDEENAPGCELTHQRLGQTLGRYFPHPHRRRYRTRHECWVGHRRQIDPPQAVRKGVEHLGCYLQSQAGLAAAAGAGQREQARFAQQALDQVELGLAADERRELAGQIVRHPVQRQHRRELIEQVGVAQLPDVFGPGQVAQSVRTQIAQVGRVRRMVSDHLVGRLRQHDLPAVSDRSQPGTPVERGSPVGPVVAQLRFTGMQRHTDPQLTPTGPPDAAQRTLDVDRARRSVRRACEHQDRAITLPLLDRPSTAVVDDAISDDLFVTTQGCRRRVGLPMPGRPLDVGKQERNGSHWQPPSQTTRQGISLAKPAPGHLTGATSPNQSNSPSTPSSSGAPADYIRHLAYAPRDTSDARRVRRARPASPRWAAVIVSSPRR